MVYIDRECDHAPSVAVELSDLAKESPQNTGQRTIRRAQGAKHPLLRFVFAKGLDPAPHPPKSTSDARYFAMLGKNDCDHFSQVFVLGKVADFFPQKVSEVLSPRSEVKYLGQFQNTGTSPQDVF